MHLELAAIDGFVIQIVCGMWKRSLLLLVPKMKYSPEREVYKQPRKVTQSK